MTKTRRAAIPGRVYRAESAATQGAGFTRATKRSEGSLPPEQSGRQSSSEWSHVGGNRVSVRRKRMGN